MKKKYVLIVFAVLSSLIFSASGYALPEENVSENNTELSVISFLKGNSDISERTAAAISDILSEEGITAVDYLKGKTDSDGNSFLRIFNGTYYYDFYLLGGNIVKCTDEDGQLVYFNEEKNNELIRIAELKRLLVLKNITRTVKRGDNAEISLRNLKSGDVCDISVVYFSGNKSTAKGLEPKTVPENGEVSWSWTIGGNVTPGIASVTVSGPSFSYSYEIMIEDKN